MIVILPIETGHTQLFIGSCKGREVVKWVTYLLTGHLVSQIAREGSEWLQRMLLRARNSLKILKYRFLGTEG